MIPATGWTDYYRKSYANLKHAFTQMHYRFEVIYKTLSILIWATAAAMFLDVGLDIRTLEKINCLEFRYYPLKKYRL